MTNQAVNAPSDKQVTFAKDVLLYFALKRNQPLKDTRDIWTDKKKMNSFLARHTGKMPTVKHLNAWKEKVGPEALAACATELGLPE